MNNKQQMPGITIPTSRRDILKACIATGAAPVLAALPGVAAAAPAGGPTDATARLIAQKLTDRLGQPVIVDNRPGASGSIGTVSMIKSPADGYTISMFGMPAAGGYEETHGCGV